MTIPDRHTCRNQKTAEGPDWLCPHCSNLPTSIPTEEECQHVAEYVLEHGIGTTVLGSDESP